jgi:hypothetical protein
MFCQAGKEIRIAIGFRESHPGYPLCSVSPSAVNEKRVIIGRSYTGKGEDTIWFN